MRRKVSNEEFELALANKDNKNIINSFAWKYRHVLDPDDIKSCGLYALWRCLQYHSNDFKRKFTTSLFMFLTFEFSRLYNKPKNESVKPVIYQDDYLKLDNKEFIDYYLGKISKDSAQLISQYFLHGLSLREISKTSHQTKKEIQARLDLALEEFRKQCENH